MSKVYGTIHFENGNWCVTAAPHVILKLKQLFPKISKRQFGTIRLSHNPENCRDLYWFLERYPMEMGEGDLASLAGWSRHYDERLANLERFLDPNYKPPPIQEMALPLRDYQLTAVHLFKAQGSLLLGDAVGLGKTPTAIGSLADPSMLPAVVVCQTHLCKQWALEQIPKFLPHLQTHIVKKGTPYDIPFCDVLVITYTKLAGWVEYLISIWKPKIIIYDEIQELRHIETAKYSAAKKLTEYIPNRQGLSATPIFNFGGEYYNILQILRPGILGDRVEFEREWCNYSGGKMLIKDTKAFGSYLRDNFLLLNRSRKEVGRELPPITRIIHTVPHDKHCLDLIEDSALALAKLVLEGTFLERGQAAREFSMKLRQATGIGKAPYVADFIRMAVESEEKVLVFGWHREVYEILNAKLSDLGVVMYTGSELSSQKASAKHSFCTPRENGGADICLMSLRSAAGLDGLQEVCTLAVFAELDWSPAVLEQCVGRIARDRSDGEFNHVTEVYMVSDSGSDPVMAELLGLKTSQLKGVMDPNEDEEDFQTDPEWIKKLALNYIQQVKK